eukprot:COSAG01_NODE_70591_length_258_cov_0.647799_1_plen_21_part_10
MGAWLAHDLLLPARGVVVELQ